MADIVYPLQVIVLGVQGLKSVDPKKVIYCTIDVEGETKLQTEHVPASDPVWNTQGDYTMSHPLPVVKLKLYMETAGLLSLEDKELGKVILRVNPYFSQNAEWYQMIVPRSSPDRELKINVICRMENPPSFRHCGELYALGKVCWKKWKKRYHVLHQLSDNLYTLMSYKEKKTDSIESILMDGYTIDYIESEKAHLMVGMSLKGGSYFFSAVKEGDNILLATDDDRECRAWVAALYKATGQPNKPIHPNAKAANPKTSRASADISAGSMTPSRGLKK